MNLERQISTLDRSADTIRMALGGVGVEQARWKPDEKSWSIVEVITHLYDEEREDFRPRLDIMLHRPTEEVVRIDPVRWVVEREYNKRQLVDSLAGFMSEREKSLQWLRELRSPNWDAKYLMPSGVSMRAGDMLAAWVAHDLLHLRQLVRLLWWITGRDLEPYNVDYAGPW